MECRGWVISEEGESMPTVGVGKGSFNQGKITGEEFVRSMQVSSVVIVGTWKTEVQFEQLCPGSGEIRL